MDIYEVLKALTNYAKMYVKDGVKSVNRNSHMNEIKNEGINQKQLEAVIVDYINYIGARNGVDYALYTSDLKK